MEKQQLEIEKNGEYQNITVATRYKWDKAAKQFEFDEQGNKVVNVQGIKPGHYIEVRKKFVEGRQVDGKFGTSYSCAVEYEGEEVTFWLKEWPHKDYARTGGEGDLIRISCVMEERLNKKLGVKVPVEVLKFEKVE